MRKQVFNLKDKPWEPSESIHAGKTKNLIDKDLFSGGALRIVKLSAGENFHTHEHEFLQVLYFTSGEGILTVDEELHSIESGLTAIILPNQCHAVENTSENDLELIVFESYQLPDNDTPYVDF